MPVCVVQVLTYLTFLNIFFAEMPAYQEEPVIDVTSPDSSILITTLSTPSSEQSISQESDSDSSIYQANDLNYAKILEIPIDPSLKDILISSTGTNDLDSIVTVKLQVIAVDLCLQHLSIYTPNLTELILDGSVLLSLRDLGCDLKNLKILRVCRCNLTSLDGMFGLESLVELYAGNNRIEDLSPCAFLPYIRILDLRKNYIRDINTVSFLVVCPYLEHIVLDENEELVNTNEYRSIVQKMLPNLITLDNIDFCKEEMTKIKQKEPEVLGTSPNGGSFSKEHFLPQINIKSKNGNLSGRRSSIDGGTQFSVNFLPKVMLPQSQRPSSTQSTITSYPVALLPDINQKSVR